MHLDARTHADLLAGTLRRNEARLLARHLAEGCERCEDFLAARDGTDAADARVDRALAAVAQRGEEGSDAELASIERRLRAGEGWSAGNEAGALPDSVRPEPVVLQAHHERGRTRRPWARRRTTGALAAAAVVVIAGLAALVARGPDRPEWDGTKGAAPSPSAVRLRFVVVDGAEGPDALRRGASGEAIAPPARLEFEVELGHAAHVALARVGPDATVDVFWTGALEAGASIVTLDGRPAAYGLDGLRGPQRFVAIASAAPLDGPAAARAAVAGARDGSRAPAPAIATDAVEVRVE
jgi:hypothetical protein